MSHHICSICLQKYFCQEFVEEKGEDDFLWMANQILHQVWPIGWQQISPLSHLPESDLQIHSKKYFVMWIEKGGAGSVGNSLLTILVCSGWCLLHLSFSNLFKKKYVNDYEDWMGVVAVANSLLAILVCSALHSSIRSAACICLGCQYLESLWPRWRLIICMECIWLRMTEALSIFFQDYLITEEKA